MGPLLTKTALTAVLVLGAGPALATDITVKDFVGKIVIENGSDSIDIRRDDRRLEAVDRDGRISIDGGFSDPHDEEKVCSYGRGFKISWNMGDSESWDKRLENYPSLRLSVPQDSTLRVENSYVRLINNGTLASADLNLEGCIDVDLGTIGDAEISKSGSGDMDAVEISRLELSKSGSGDFEVVRLGTAEIKLSGSGDLEFDRVNGSLDITKSGSGDVDISEINGSLSIRKSGSGDIDVSRGTIPQFELNKSGSGEAEIDADIVDAVVKSHGSGDVYLRNVSGTLESSTSGSGDLDVGSRD